MGGGRGGWSLAKSFWAIFFGFAKFPFLWVWQISSFFRSSNSCITHLNPLNEEHTVLMKNKIIVAFQIYLYKYDIETEKLILGIHFFAVCILSLLFIYLFIYLFFFFFLVGWRLNLASFNLLGSWHLCSDKHLCQRNVGVSP